MFWKALYYDLLSNMNNSHHRSTCNSSPEVISQMLQTALLAKHHFDAGEVLE
jgi:hypothetical protein